MLLPANWPLLALDPTHVSLYPSPHCVLAKHYGFTDQEPDFIFNCDIKYRMGRGSVEEEK
jgi:hypothetical protein